MLSQKGLSALLTVHDSPQLFWWWKASHSTRVDRNNSIIPVKCLAKCLANPKNLMKYCIYYKTKMPTVFLKGIPRRIRFYCLKAADLRSH